MNKLCLDRQFPTLLSERSRTFSIQRMVSESDQSKTGSGRRTMHDAINLEGKGLKSGFTHCYTLDASLFGWCDVKVAQRSIAFTIKEYERFGRDTGLPHIFRLSGLTSLGCGQHLTSETCFFNLKHTHFGIHTTQLCISVSQ